MRTRWCRVSVMSGDGIRLLDVVPWTHGYAHSWALRWMLQNSDAARSAVLGLFLPDAHGPWTIHDIRREYPVGRHRVDLRIATRGADDQQRAVLVETKVNDALSESQLRTYS